MKEVMGIINNANERKYLRDITKDRSMATVPFGGRYRMIDFPLSCLVNSGIGNVGILVQNNYRSLFDHVKSGREWNLARKNDGLFILPSFRQDSEANLLKGDIQLFHANLDYIKFSRQSVVVITATNYLCNIDYREVVDFHREKKADITVITRKPKNPKACEKRSIMVDADGSDRITDMKVNAGGPYHSSQSLEMYVINKDLLVKLIENCYSRGDYDFTMDAMIKNVNSLRMYAYNYEGYAADVLSVESYFEQNMELLKPENWEELFLKGGPIFTKVRDQSPAKYFENSKVSNSMIGSGCKIEGEVENSIVFRGVHIKPGSKVRNSILMQDAIIEEGAEIDRCILDKEAVIKKDMKLVGAPDYTIIIEKQKGREELNM